MWRSITISKKIWICVSIAFLVYFASMAHGVFITGQAESRRGNVSEFTVPASRFSKAAVMAFDRQIKLYTEAIVAGDDALLEASRRESGHARNALIEISRLPGIDQQLAADINTAVKRIDTFTNEARHIYLAMAMAEGNEGRDIQAEALRLSKETTAIKELLGIMGQHFLTMKGSYRRHSP